MASKTEVAIALHAPTETIAEHLEALAEGLRNGRIAISQGEKVVDLRPYGQVDLDVVATKKGARNSLSLELGWRDEPELVGEIYINISPAPEDEGNGGKGS